MITTIVLIDAVSSDISSINVDSYFKQALKHRLTVGPGFHTYLLSDPARVLDINILTRPVY